jgi:hypothetical protein
MATPTSGQIKFSQIASEFQGTAPHKMSELYALAGSNRSDDGVPGVPGSGLIKFTDMYSRARTQSETNSVWTNSGYNQWQYSGWYGSFHRWNHQSTYILTQGFSPNWSTNNQNYQQGALIGYMPGIVGGGYSNSSFINYIGTLPHSGGWTTIHASTGSGQVRQLQYKKNQWVDTSSYQDQTTTYYCNMT